MNGTADVELLAPPLSELLTLERIDSGLYRGGSGHLTEGALYGGQVLGQALMACGATVSPDRTPHSLHAYFLRRGDASRPVVYRVENDRDGGSYSSRRVVAIQNGEVVLSMSASFRLRVGGESYVQVPEPEKAKPIHADPEVSLEVLVQKWPTAQEFFPREFWARPNAPLPEDDSLMHAAAIAYMSDFSTGLDRRHEGKTIGPSLDHTLWFHSEADWKDWLIVEHAPGIVRGSRGWYSGTIRNGSGEVVASLAQEMVYREPR